MIGDSSVGKSSIISYLKNKTFKYNTVSTIGLLIIILGSDYITKYYETVSLNLNIYDTSG